MTGATDDPIRSYTIEEQARLTAQLAAITRQVHGGAFAARPLDLDLLRSFHAALFRGVRDHAGRIRGPGFGAERLVFGPNRSTHRDDVARELAAIFDRTSRDVRALRSRESDEDYELEALRLAVWAHAEVVHVHPFEDGNGRTSRLCAGHLLVSLGLRPVAVEAVKQEYTEARNHYYTTHDIEPLLDLFIALHREVG